MRAASLDRRGFVAAGLESRLEELESPHESPMEKPLYFWLGAAPFIGLALVFVLLGEYVYAAAAPGAYLALMTLLFPRVGLYALFTLQAWDPYFVHPSLFFDYIGIVTPTKILSLVIVSSYLLHLLGRHYPLRSSRGAMVCFALFTLWALFISPFAPNAPFAFRLAAQVAVLVILALAAARFIRTREQIRRWMFWTITGGLTASLALNLVGDPSEVQRGTLGEFSNPNSTAFSIGLAMMCIPAAWGVTKTRMTWAYYTPVAAFLMMTLMKTGSRATCVGVVLAYSLGGLLTRGKGLGKKVSAAVFASAFGAGVFFAVLEARILSEKSQERLEAIVYGGDEVIRDNSRFQIWNYGIQTFFSRPIFGTGLGNAAAAMALVVPGQARDVHSNYVAALVETGLIGAGLFFAALFGVGLAAWRIPQANPGVPATILLIYVLFISLTHTTYTTKAFWFPVAIILILAEYGLARGAHEEKPLD